MYFPPHRRDVTTFVELLRWRASHQPDRRAYTFLLDGESLAADLTYAELDQQARALAALLHPQTQPGDRALLLYPPGLDYIVAFFGCLYAGVIAVPAYPPQSANLERALPQRLRAITEDARPTVALTTAAALPIGAALAAQDALFGSMQWLATDQLDTAALAEPWSGPRPTPSSVAFLQYTSGSTATPKGVMVSHGNLLHNSELIAQGFGHSAESQGVIWLPPYHDMGLIGGILQPLYVGFPVTLLAPLAFLQRPIRWLQAITRERATTSGGPNFAYDLCVRKTTPEQRAALDLSSWTVAFNGAEPVRAETLDRFTAAFAEHGFRRSAFYPCYGLAEATLIVTGGQVRAEPAAQTVDAAALEQHAVRAAEPHGVADERATSTRTLIGCGRPLLEQQLMIVQPQSASRCTTDQVGEIWVRGPSVAQGYWQQPGPTAQTFAATLADDGSGPFLRTGDLGFVRDGQLYVTGRLKDLIIIRGRNHYPQDIEQTVERSHAALSPGGAAAFTIEVAGDEQLVVVQEIERRQRHADVTLLSAAIRQAVAAEHELQVYAVVLLSPGHLPRTTSGKVQRHACRAQFLAGTLQSIGSSILDLTSVPTVADSALSRAELERLQPAEQLAQLTGYLQARLAQVARVAPSAIDLEQPIAALGIDSLMAVELQHRVEIDLELSIPMVSFLQAPSLAALADELKQALAAPPVTDEPAPATLAAAQPLSAGQRALWLLHQLSPESSAYTIPTAIRVRGPLDVAALRRAFQRLIERHATLRTVFDAPHGEPLQIVREQAEVALELHDARAWSPAMLATQLSAEAQRPFDIRRGPLLRLALFARGADEHILLLTVHHIVADLWSLAVLLQELRVLYPAARAGSADHDTLPPLRAGYAEYVRWEQRLLAGPAGEQLWSGWRQRLADAPTVLNLPTDRPRPALQTFAGAALAFQLDAALSQRLKQLAEAEGVTLYTLLLAAFSVLLSRMSGQDDLLIGSPTAGRSRAEHSGIVGYFVNPVVLRARTAAGQPFRALLAEVRQETLAALAGASLPFVTLVERLQPLRDPARSPVFQVMFAWQQAPLLDAAATAFALGGAAELPLDDLIFETVPLEQRAAQFELSLAMGETGGRIAATLEYNSDLFDATTARRIADRLTTLLDAIAARPEQTVGALPVLTDDELRLVSADWNATAAELSGPRCIHELVAAQAARSPEAIALIFDDQRVSYAELETRANQLAHELRARGVGQPQEQRAPREVLLGLLVERSVDLLVAVLAILKAGGAYIPLDPAYPAERLRAMLSDAQATLLVTQAALLDALPELSMPTLCLDRDGPQIAARPTSAPPSRADASSAACVIYTSGSTGRPKGVVLQHASIVNLVASFAHSYQTSPEDRLLPLTSLAAATFVGEIFPPLCSGGTLVLPSTVEILDVEALYRLMARHDVTIVSTVPALLSRLNAGIAALPRLRLVLSGGEALTGDAIDHLRAAVTLANGYGLTETTVCSTSALLAPGAAALTGAVPIGRPILNTQVYVLDDQLRPLPIGCDGELYVGGVGLARGYLHDPALTAARFVPNPFGAISGSGSGRLYKTGDRARWLPDGQIEYVGRIDQQVKVRGFRVELGEIEAALQQQPGVREAVVVVREDGPQRRLVAYLVAEQAEAHSPEPGIQQANGQNLEPKSENHGVPDQSRTEPAANDPAHGSENQTFDSLFAARSSASPALGAPAELRAALRMRLPEYMLPTTFVVLPSLPLSPNGKVDRRALSQRPIMPEQQMQADPGTAQAPPRSELERTIAAVWRSVLQLEQVGIHDNFFDLGGHSLLLVQVHAALRQSFSALPLLDLFQYPTISALAAHISAAQPATDAGFDEEVERARKQRARRDQRQQMLRNLSD